MFTIKQEQIAFGLTTVLRVGIEGLSLLCSMPTRSVQVYWENSERTDNSNFGNDKVRCRWTSKRVTKKYKALDHRFRTTVNSQSKKKTILKCLKGIAQTLIN